MEAASDREGESGVPEPQNPSHALALVLVDELARGGVTDAVLAPGSRSTALAMALHDEPRIHLHVAVDERSAAFCALGLGRATSRPAVVVTTSGSAVANLHPAVVEADMGRVPLLLLTADRPPELRHTAANQAIDQLGVFGRAVRWFVEVGVAEDRPGAPTYWRSTTSRALAEASGLGGPPGPVHANLAFREPTVPATDDGRSAVPGPFQQPLDGRRGAGWAAGAGPRPWTSVSRAPRVLPTEDLQGFAARVAGTERGLIVLGDVSGNAALAGPVEGLSDVAGWPVIAEPTSGARTGDHVVSAAHHLLGDPGFAAAHRPDLVLRIGRQGLSRNVAALLGPQVPQVLVDADGAWLDPERSVADLVVADPARFCEGLAAHLPVAAGSDWRDAWQAAEQAATAAIDAVLDADDAPSEPRTARDVAAALPDGATLVAASSMPVRDLDRCMRPRRGLRVVGNRGASGIDGHVATTLGAALAGESPVVALSGDLSLLHDANGFLLSPGRERLDAVFVVLDNDGGGIFSFLPQAGYAGFERLFATPHGRDLADLAGLHRLGYQEVTRASDLPGALAGALGAGGIHLLHVRTDRAANRDLHRLLQAEVTTALRTA